MKGKRIAEIGDLVLLEHVTAGLLKIAIKKRNEFWDFGLNWDYDNIYKNYREIEILEKNFQETAPVVIVDYREQFSQDPLTSAEIRALRDTSMNWKEWCLWGFIIICAIIAFYRWGYVK